MPKQTPTGASGRQQKTHRNVSSSAGGGSLPSPPGSDRPGVLNVGETPTTPQPPASLASSSLHARDVAANAGQVDVPVEKAGASAAVTKMYEVASKLAELTTDILLANSAEEKFRELDRLCRDFGDVGDGGGTAATATAKRRDLAAQLREERIRHAQEALAKVSTALFVAVQDIPKPLRVAEDEARRQLGDLRAEIASVRAELDAVKREARKNVDECAATADAAKAEAARLVREAERRVDENVVEKVSRVREMLEQQITAVQSNVDVGVVVGQMRTELDFALGRVPTKDQITKEIEASVQRWAKVSTEKAGVEHARRLADVDKAARKQEGKMTALDAKVERLKIEGLATIAELSDFRATLESRKPETCQLQDALAQLQRLQQVVDEISQSKILKSKSFAEKLEHWMNRMANESQVLAAEIRQLRSHIGLEEGEIGGSKGKATTPQSVPRDFERKLRFRDLKIQELEEENSRIVKFLQSKFPNETLMTGNFVGSINPLQVPISPSGDPLDFFSSSPVPSKRSRYT